MSDYVTALILLMSYGTNNSCGTLVYKLILLMLYRDKQFLWYFSVQADIVNVI